MARVPIAVLAACMLFTGSLFTIVLKLQDTEVVGHRPDGTPITFRHPALQTACMFAGEALCLIPHFIWRWSRRGLRTPTDRAASDARHRAAAWAFGLPALCDAGGTTMLNLGLYYTSASACQMLRGTLVVFAGLLTITVLKRKLYAHHWAGITLICAGAALAVGVGHHNTSAPNPLLGNLLVILAQLLAACQFIGEEKLLTQHRAPVLLAVGVEGAWGLAIAALALPLLSVVRGRGGEPLDSLPDALRALRASPRLQWTTAAAVASIGAFNFFGVSVTKNLSGGSRAAIDACRTLFVWLFSLWAGWERAHVLQLVGFVVLISGTSVYNEILRSPSGRGGGALGASTASVSVLASSVSATALADESGGSDGEGEPARWQPSPGRSRRGEYGRTP
ncbi:Solute carrier family 35 member F6 [Auxenochlorella protothecoides]|uniref:Solute carrier family 35 member F6 n=1 Tax=Auxenochlorella protothecoides TaxID=3075 RepID=A0A087SMI8_AUXPR|nr:Solute carrier family 35 member F6 [Auxenochlorella protothecoides]KFM26942.1 Solute carrier family 35 member F6 [Auxenochlorella protothecoides]